MKPPASSGGGGGGSDSPLDASKGKLPKAAPRQFTPPRVDPTDSKLPMAPSIVADAPNINAPNYGDPLGKMGTPSNGTGFGGGIGSGNGVGIGPGAGMGYGGGFSGGVYAIGRGVSSPVIIHKVEPDYSEEARKKKWQGTVQLSVIVDETGHPRDIKVRTNAQARPRSESHRGGREMALQTGHEGWKTCRGLRDHPIFLASPVVNV